MIKGSPRPKQTDSTQGYCPTLQNSPTNMQKNSAAAAVPAKPHRNEIWGILPEKRKVPHGWPHGWPRFFDEPNCLSCDKDNMGSQCSKKFRNTP